MCFGGEAEQFFPLVCNPSFTVIEAVLEVGLVKRLNGFEPEKDGFWQALSHFC